MALWVLFLAMFIPMLNLATIGVRTGALFSAAGDAAYHAARASSYLSNLSATQPSAVTIAQTEATNSLSGFSGITLSTVNTYIVYTNLATQQTIRQNSPLSVPADTNVYCYQLEVMLTAQVKPLITLNSAVLGNIPGITTPMTVKASSKQFAEYPDGLNQ
jgi:hypothetical protein